jgi:uncharacterized membrane protein
MACAQMVQLFPQGDMSNSDYENTIRNQSAANGQLCAVNNYATNCATQCAQMSKNYNGCASCLSDTNSCSLVTSDGKTVACCPIIGPATTCNNCMGLYSVDALATCLQTGLSTGAIIGIVVAVVIVVIILIVVVVVVVRSRQQEQAKHDLGLNIELEDLNGVNLNEALEHRKQRRK